MNTVSLSKLTLKNFKGIRSLTVEFGPQTDIYGINGAGKTTLYDAFLWLLFDKDSANHKDFDIKPLDENNKVIRGLNPEVEGVLYVGGRNVTLHKVYSEKWTKKRGSAMEEFTGHTTDYFVDGVPCKLTEYKAAVDAIADEDVFKLLTSPTYFNTVLDWKSRRKILLEVCGDVSDEDVLSGNKNLAKLPDILSGRSIEDHRKVIAGKRKEINEELERIPVRIDEANRSMPDVEGLDEDILDTEIHGLRVTIDQQSAQLVKVQNGVGIAELEKRLREIDGEVLDIKNRARKAVMGTTDAQARRVQEMQTQLYTLQDNVTRAQAQVTRFVDAAAEKRQEAEKLRAQWAEVNTQTLEPHVDENCPTCGQALPAEQIQAAHEKALANFNREKAERLERIAGQGKAAVAEAGRVEAEIEKQQTYIAEQSAAIETVSTELQAAKAELERLQSSVTSVEDDPKLIAKLREFEQVSSQLMELRQSSAASVQAIQEGIVALRAELQRKEQDKAKFTQVSTLTRRIEELKQQERALASEFEALEEQLYLSEEFIRTKVHMLENRINSKFRYARFKLFEQQINGGLSEVCETLYNGVPYGSGLNHAARIQVGIDICNTLSVHYGMALPMWIDNRESVTEVVDTESQLVNLIVSPKDKTIRIESGLVKEAV